MSAPSFSALETIEAFIHKKSPWIVRKIEEHKNKRTLLENKRFVDGAKFLFLGQPYELSLKTEDVKRPLVHLTPNGWEVWISPKMTEKHIKKEFEGWYRAQAEEILMKQISLWFEKLGITDCDVKVRSQKRIWGSCHPRRRKIFLNWQLVMAPREVIDYVIVHEICHLWIASHSQRFWKKVESILPEYKQCHKWFKENSSEMVLP